MTAISGASAQVRTPKTMATPPSHKEASPAASASSSKHQRFNAGSSIIGGLFGFLGGSGLGQIADAYLSKGSAKGGLSALIAVTVTGVGVLIGGLQGAKWYNDNHSPTTQAKHGAAALRPTQ